MTKTKTNDTRMFAARLRALTPIVFACSVLLTLLFFIDRWIPSHFSISSIVVVLGACAIGWWRSTYIASLRHMPFIRKVLFVTLVFNTILCTYLFWARFRHFHYWPTDPSWPQSFPYPDQFINAYHDWINTKSPMPEKYGEYHTIGRIVDRLILCVLAVLAGAFGMATPKLARKIWTWPLVEKPFQFFASHVRLGLVTFVVGMLTVAATFGWIEFHYARYQTEMSVLRDLNKTHRIRVAIKGSGSHWDHVSIEGPQAIEWDGVASLEWQGPPWLQHKHGITYFYHLSEIRLVGPNVSDEIVRPLSRLKRLATLSLEKTRVSETSVAKIRQSLPECRVIVFH